MRCGKTSLSEKSHLEFLGDYGLQVGELLTPKCNKVLFSKSSLPQEEGSTLTREKMWELDRSLNLEPQDPQEKLAEVWVSGRWIPSVLGQPVELQVQ